MSTNLGLSSVAPLAHLDPGNPGHLFPSPSEPRLALRTVDHTLPNIVVCPLMWRDNVFTHCVHDILPHWNVNLWHLYMHLKQFSLQVAFVLTKASPNTSCLVNWKRCIGTIVLACINLNKTISNHINNGSCNCTMRTINSHAISASIIRIHIPHLLVPLFAALTLAWTCTTQQHWQIYHHWHWCCKMSLLCGSSNPTWQELSETWLLTAKFPHPMPDRQIYHLLVFGIVPGWQLSAVPFEKSSLPAKWYVNLTFGVITIWVSNVSFGCQ